MTVRFVLEREPTPQRDAERLYHGGHFVVGRGDDADWRIEDPEMFVSRKHFVVSDDGDGPIVTDASTGGLFVDGASKPLGAGNSVALEDGMRLRFGDFVLRVETQADEAKDTRAIERSGPFSFEFGPAEAPPTPQERPNELPPPFGVAERQADAAVSDESVRSPPPLDREDPFALDLSTALRTLESERGHAKDPADRQSYFGSVETPLGETQSFVHSEVRDHKEKTEEPEPSREPYDVSDEALRAAFYKGLGIDPHRHAIDDPLAEMEAMGRRFRALTEGLVELLRVRSQEKQKVRVAQTIVGNANVNPLKFAVGPDDAVGALVAERSVGYLAPDDAIREAFRDLADHQVRTWAALQSALRRMIDRFDPEEVERNLESTGRLEALLAGGRSAKLWQLYEERYRDIARAAEEKFLGEVGADFRDAYEKQWRD